MIEVDNLKKLLGSEFDVKDLGEGEKIIGMEILRDRILDVLYLNQRRYIEKLLEQSIFMMNLKPVSTPFDLSSGRSLSLNPWQKKRLWLIFLTLMSWEVWCMPWSAQDRVLPKRLSW